MPVFNSSPRLRVGGIFAVVVGLALLIGIGNVASAEPDAQAQPTPVPCVVVKPGVQVILGNPQPGDTLQSGTNPIMQGIAYDSRATSGSGIQSVQIYLGDRNTGGIFLGNVVLGQPNPQAGPGSQFATAGFTLRTPTLPVGSGSRSIFVYAKSSVDGSEASLEVPVYLNAAPTPVKGQVPTPVLPPPPTCTPAPAPTATAAPATPTAAPAAAAATVVPVGQPATTAVTPTPFPTLAPLPAPAVPAPVAPPVVAPSPVIPSAPGAVTPAVTQTTAPRGGGIPSELGIALLAGGVLVIGGGMVLRRRQRRAAPAEAEL